MFLSSDEIRMAVDEGLIGARPAFLVSDLRPFGFRIRLGQEFLEPVASEIALNGSNGDAAHKTVALDADGYYMLEPGGFVLATTSQAFYIDGTLAGFLDGRSTVARLGLLVHVSSQIIDGMSVSPRRITLELRNLGPHRIRLAPGDAIGMLSFFRSATKSDNSLVHAQYHDQDGPVAPRIAGWVSESTHGPDGT